MLLDPFLSATCSLLTRSFFLYTGVLTLTLACVRTRIPPAGDPTSDVEGLLDVLFFKLRGCRLIDFKFVEEG